MNGRIDKLIDTYIQAAFDVAMEDLLISSDEKRLLRIIETETYRMREEAYKLENTNYTDKELRERLRLLTVKLFIYLSEEAIADGKITDEECAILRSIII